MINTDAVKPMTQKTSTMRPPLAVALSGLLILALTWRISTLYMQIATVNLFLLLVGFTLRRVHRNAHVTLMSLGMLSDVTLVLILEFQRHAINTALSFKLSGLNQAHIFFSTLATVCYFPVTFFGLALFFSNRLFGKVWPSARARHKSIGWLTLILRTLGFFLMFSLLDKPSHADWELVPTSRDQQYRTFGLFIDNQTSALFLPHGNNVWLALGEQIPVVENHDWYGSPQFVVFASINAGDRLNSAGSTILMETVDIRAGLSYEFSIDSKSRVAASWMHQSGHTSDDVQDARLVYPNLGNEELMFRFLHDVEDRFRVGATLKPYIGSDPGLVRWASDQFSEWYPWGTAPHFEKLTPFIAGGLEQWGPDRVRMNYHAQAGVYIGNHLQPLYKVNVRYVLGYYNGVDPRFKYAQFVGGNQQFFYTGLQVGL